MIDKVTEKSCVSTADSAISLRDCAYSAMPKGGDLLGSTSHAQKSIDDIFGKLSITDEHADSPKPSAKQLALEVIPGSKNYGIGFTPNGSMVMGPMKDGKILGGGRTVLSPDGGATFSPTLLLTGPKV